MGVSPPPSFENLPFLRAKTVVQCTFTGQFSGPKIIGELLLLKIRPQTKILAGQPLTPPGKKFVEIMSLVLDRSDL